MLSFLAEPFGDLQKALGSHGIRLNLYVNDQYQAVLKGGANANGSGRNAGSTDLFLTFDFDEMKLLDNSELLIHFQANWGAGINRRTGALYQVNDDADGSIGGHIAQMWYRLFLWDGKAALRIGYLDYQTIIDRNAFANSEDKQFWHQTLDNNPLVPLNIGLGASLTLRPTEWYTLILGTGDSQNRPYASGFNTTFNGTHRFYGFLEQGVHLKFKSDRGPLSGNYRVGVVYDPKPKSKFDGGDGTPQTGDWGVWVSADQVLFRESKDNNQGLGVFFRFGYRDSRVNRLSTFFSGGVQYMGLVRGRDEDVLGLGFATYRAGNDYRHFVNRVFGAETVYELYYAVKVCPNLVVTPDIQYVDRVGAAGAYRDLIVAGVRLRLSL